MLSLEIIIDTLLWEITKFLEYSEFYVYAMHRGYIIRIVLD